MRSTYKQLYYINRSKVKADGTTSIMCRITIDGKAVALSTGLYCQPEEWISKKGEVKNNSKHSVNHVFSSPTSIINFTSKKPSYDDTRRSGRDNELLQRAQNDL